MPLKAKVIDIIESSRLNARGELERTMRVSYTIGDYGPFTVDIPTEKFSKEELDRIIQEKTRTLEDIAREYG